jgi:hypothetical protein
VIPPGRKQAAEDRLLTSYSYHCAGEGEGQAGRHLNVKTSVTTEEQSSGGAHAAGEQWRGTGMEGKKQEQEGEGSACGKGVGTVRLSLSFSSNKCWGKIEVATCNSEQVMKRGTRRRTCERQQATGLHGISSEPPNAQRAPKMPRQLLSNADRRLM